MRIILFARAAVRFGAEVGVVVVLVACGGSEATSDNGPDAHATDAGMESDAGDEGGRDAALMCPTAAPTVGSPCQGTQGLCSYGGGICCGGAYSCSSNKTWQILRAGCACVMPDGGRNKGEDGGDSGESADGGHFSCGSRSCTATQVCVQPTCGGGAAPACNRVDDAGGCEAGWTFSTTCYVQGSGLGAGCLPPPCTPPAPFCADVPNASCAAAPTCSCVPSNICNDTGTCIDAINHEVTCGAE